MYKRAKRGKYAQTVVVHLLVSSHLKLAILVEPFSAWLVSLVDFDVQQGGDTERLILENNELKTTKEKLTYHRQMTHQKLDILYNGIDYSLQDDNTRKEQD